MTAAPVWTDPTPLHVLGMGSALPGPALATGALLDRVEQRFGLAIHRRGLAVARRLGILTRHVCRPFEAALEPPRPGQGNPDLAAAALRSALAQAGLQVTDLSYLIAHTASPATALPGNVAQVAALLGYRGPFAEFRQACTGFVNGLVFAQGLLRAGSGPVAIVGSETGSVHFDPSRAAVDLGQLVNLVQMGDGAAAIVLAPDDEGGPGATPVPRLPRPGRRRDNVPAWRCSHGGSAVAGSARTGSMSSPTTSPWSGEAGPGLLRQCAAIAAAAAGIAPTDWVLPHQANGRMDELLHQHWAASSGDRVVVHVPACRQHRVGRDLAGAGGPPGGDAPGCHAAGAGGRSDGAHVWRVPLCPRLRQSFPAPA